ncbi:MAG: AroM family protein [Dehalococcoidia bacterium]|jgi:protein AroM|nr:AroM family protein [Dehalococcoidia bacterium]
MLGLVTIGQTPRPDFETAFREYVPGVDFQIVGALDGFAADEIEALSKQIGDFPLHMLLADGSTCDIQQRALTPLVDQRMRELVSAGATAVGLLCTGRFHDFDPGVPVLMPGKLLPAVAGAIAPSRRIGVIAPIESQIEPMRDVWESDGFSVTVAVASPYHDGENEAAARVMADAAPELVVLDCMGHGPASRDEFSRLSGRPVLTAQTLLAKVAGEIAGSL